VLVGSQVAGLVVAVVVVGVAGASPPAGIRIVYGVLAGLVGAVGLAFFYRGLATAAMGVVAPIAATAVFVPLAVGLARGERPAALQDAGIALALVGVVLVSREPGREPSRRVAGGVGLALLSAGCFGLALLGLSSASKGGALWGGLSLRIGGVTPILLAAVVLGRRTAAVPRGWNLTWIALVGVTDTVASFLYADATTRGLLSVVAVVASLYPVLVVGLARTVLHERLARPQLAGAAAALTGIALISAG
jgi:drug/metabolite transporter (DMT)-like permease